MIGPQIDSEELRRRSTSTSLGLEDTLFNWDDPLDIAENNKKERFEPVELESEQASSVPTEEVKRTNTYRKRHSYFQPSKVDAGMNIRAGEPRSMSASNAINKVIGLSANLFRDYSGITPTQSSSSLSRFEKSEGISEEPARRVIRIKAKPISTRGERKGYRLILTHLRRLEDICKRLESDVLDIRETLSNLEDHLPSPQPSKEAVKEDIII